MTRSKWMRLMFAAFAMFALVAFAAACGDDDDDDDDDGATAEPGEPTEAGGDDDKMGGEVTIHYLEHDSFDPHYSSFSQTIGATGMVFRGLYGLDANNEPWPEMAAELPEISEDGLTYTIKLKDGLVWSDGDDLTAEDFVAAFHRTCNFVIGGQYQYVLTNVVGCDDYASSDNEGKTAEELQALEDAVGVSAPDPTTVVIELQNPQPTFTIILHMWMTWPVPTHIVTDSSMEWPQPQDLAFNGPFMVESYTAADSIVLVRNDNYAGPHLAYLDKLTLQYIEDSEVANNAFRNDELAAAVANTAQLTALQSEFTEELISVPSASTLSLQMNMDVEPLDNDLVRLALSRAIDRQTLNDVVLQGANVPTTTWVPGEIAGGGVGTDTFEDVIGFDPEAAAAALAEAGYPDGEGFPTLTILTRDTPAATAVAEFYQAEFLSHLNINVEIEIVDAPTRSARFGAEEFELFPGGWIQDYPDPENWIWGLFDTEGGLNHYNCSNERVDEIVSEALFEADNELRLELWREANEIISSTVCGAAPVYHLGHHYLISPALKGAAENAGAKDRVIGGDWIVEEWYLED